MMIFNSQDLGEIVDILHLEGFRPLSSPEERHGSWEWPFHRHFKGLERFVILAITPGGLPKSLDVEIWIGAQSQSRFVRRLAWSQEVTGESLPMAPELKPWLQQATREAIVLPSSSLTETALEHLRPPGSAPPAQARRAGGR